MTDFSVTFFVVSLGVIAVFSMYYTPHQFGMEKTVLAEWAEERKVLGSSPREDKTWEVFW